jgi:hypothetical protein
MAEPFRSDLEAARSRAEALEEEKDTLEHENGELREEVARLRIARSERTGGATEDPQIAKLSEETLERLDEMTHAIEGSDPPEPERLTPLPHLRVAAPPKPAPMPVPDHPRALEVARLRFEVERLQNELAKERAGHADARRWTRRLVMVAVAAALVAFAMLMIVGAR